MLRKIFCASLLAALAFPAGAAQLTPSAIKTELDGAVGVNKLLRGDKLNSIMTDMVDSYGAKLIANVWAAPQTFSAMPILAAASGCYIRANGATQVGCDTVIPAAAGGAGAVNGVLQGDGAGNVSAAPTTGTGALLRVSSSYFPGLTTNVVGTGTPGMDVTSSDCVGDGCGFMLFSAKSTYPAASPALLRVQKQFPTTGGVSGSTYAAAWTIGQTGANNQGYVWLNKTELNNITNGATGAQNVAVSATARNTTEGITLPYSYAPIWGLYAEAYDMSGQANPGYAIHGAEIDAYVNAGAGADANKNRVMLQLSGGVQNAFDSGVHIGRGLLITPNNGAIIDNAVEIRDASNNNTFLVEGNGSTTITSASGGWSGANIGKTLLLTTNPVATNPALGISDLNKTNWWALGNDAGLFEILSMPLPSDSTSTPIVAMQASHNTGGVLVRGQTGGGAPSAGMVGEEIESSIPVGSAVAMTSATPANITSVNLTAGNWLCYGSVSTDPAGGTTTSAIFGTISDTSATFPTAPNDGAWVAGQLSTPAGASVTHPVGQRIYRTASPMTVYLVATYNFAGGTMGGYGYLGCFRQF